MHSIALCISTVEMTACKNSFMVLAIAVIQRKPTGSKDAGAKVFVVCCSVHRGVWISQLKLQMLSCYHTVVYENNSHSYICIYIMHTDVVCS